MNDLTPKIVAKQIAEMVKGFRYKLDYYILDPSAGTGTLLDAVRNKFGNPKGKHGHACSNYFSVEIDSKRSVILRDKDYIHFQGDIFEFNFPKSFDLIVCSPPYYDSNNTDICIEHFKYYHERLLKKGGEMIGILNPKIADKTTTNRHSFMNWLSGKPQFRYKNLGKVEVDCGEVEACQKPMGIFYYRNN